MDNRTKERKPPDKGRVKMKPPDGLKAIPKELALGAIQNGTQRLASQLRNAGEREERSDYGGERIGSAAADGTRLAARSVEAFLKSGAAALSRSKGEEPPPDDLPFDETAPQETAPGTEAASVAEELPATEYPPLPEHAENPAFPEHPVSPEAAGTEPAFVSEQPPSAGQPPLPEHSDFPETVTPTETPVAEESQAESRSKRRSRRDEEPVQTEQSEESWRPAYQDATPTASVRPVTVIVKKSGGAAREDPGRVPRGREGGALRARNADRTVKTLAGNDAPPLLKGHSAREAALPPPAGQPAAAEYGRGKLIQERGRELAAKRTDISLSGGNAFAEPLQLPASGAEYPAPQMPEPPFMRTGEGSPNLRDALPEQASVGDSRVTLRTKETPPLAGQPNADKELVKEREPLSSAPRSGSAPTGGNASNVTPNGGATSEPESAPKAPQTGRVGVKTREASGYRTVSSDSDTAQKAAAQGKEKAIKEHAERIAERRTETISVKRESVSVPSETPVPPPEQSAVSLKPGAMYATRETPSTDTQSAAQGKEKLIRERTAQVAGRRGDTASAGQTPADSGKTSSPGSEQDAVPVKIKETYAQKVIPSGPQTDAQGKQKLVRERAERITQRHIENVTTGQSSAASADMSVAEQPAIPVKTKETSARRESSLPKAQNAAQGKGKLVKERTEQVAQRRAETVTTGRKPAAVGADTSAPTTRSVPVKTKEATRSVIPGDAKTVRERATERIPESRADTGIKTKPIPSSAEASAPTTERLPVKTRETYPVKEAPSGESRGERTLIREKARQVAERRMALSSDRQEPAAVADAPVRTKEAYAPRETPDAMPQTRTAVKERTAQIAERPAPSDSARPEVPETRRTPVKMREADVQIQEPPPQNFTVRERADAAFSETPRTERMPIKTKEAYARQESASGEFRPHPTASEHGQAFRERGAEAAAKRTDAGTVSPRIKEPERTPVKTKEAYVPRFGDAPPAADRSATVRQQAAVKTRDADIQTSASPLAEAPKEPGKTVKTRGPTQSPATAADVRNDGALPSPEPKIENGGVSGRESALPKERTNYGANPGQRKRVAEEKRAVESKPNLKKEPPGDIVKKAAGEAKPSAAPMDEGVKTKGAWLRQQGKDRPRERVTTEIVKGKPQTKGQPPVKLAKGLSIPKTADSFPLAPPWEPSSIGGGGGTGTPAARFVREKGGTTAGKIVRDLVPSGEKGLQIMRPTAIKEAGTTGAKAVKTAERSAKTLKTAQTVSFRMSRQAAQTARSVQMRRVAAAQRGAKAAASTLREAGRKAVSTAKSAVAAAQSLVSALAAGGSTALVIVIVICLVAALIAAPFGLFLSGQTGAGENIQSAMSELVGEYGARIEQIKEETDYDELDIAEDIISAMMSNRKNVLAVYAVRVTTKDADATEVVTLTDEKKAILRETFFDMNRISHHTTSRTVYSGDDDDEGTTIVTLHISVTTKSAEEMADEYHFNAGQRRLLQEMLSPEYDELFESLLGGADAGGDSPVLDPEILDGITLLMPSDLSEQRRQVVLTGAQLLGRVHYFWGGKSRVLGWDSRWGTPTRVWAAGSPSTGTVRPFGLDCSGFVDWVFYNVSDGTYLIGHGGGASSQHSYCTPISWSEALPGDLVFYPGDRHVGIVVGHDTFGNVKIMHCASGSNNVVITGKIEFVSIGRPRFYSVG